MRMKTENNMSWTRITTFPHTTGAVTISRPTSGQAIEVTLTATPRHNGSTVTCVGESKPNKGKRGEQTTTIYVRWPPSVRNLTVHGSASFRSPVTSQKPAAIRCQLQEGNPTREATATVGGRDIGAPQHTRDAGEDADGYKWKEAVWRHQFRREDNGALVVCGFEGEGGKKSVTVDVQYAPTGLVIAPAVVRPGEAVNCTAQGIPAPAVRMRPAIWRRGWEAIEGSRTAQLVVGEEEETGIYKVVCEAENLHGVSKRTAVLRIEASKKTNYFVHILVTTTVAGVLLLAVIIVLLILRAIRKQRAPLAREANTFPHRLLFRNSLQEPLLSTQIRYQVT